MLTAILLEFTHNKIVYRLYHEKLFLGYLNFIPSEEHINQLLKNDWDFLKWENWITKMYNKSYIYLTLKSNGNNYNIFICPINGHTIYALNLPHTKDFKNGFYYLEAFKGRNVYEVNLVQYNYLHNLLVNLKKDNKVNITFI